MHTKRYALVAGACLVAAAPHAVAQLEVGGDLLDSCSQIDELRAAGDFAAARDEAQRCLQGLEQQLGGEIGKFFLPEVAGWSRTSLEQDSALGLNNVSADYTKDGRTANVSLTGGSGDGFGAVLGGFARLGLAQSGQQVRVGGLPASVQEDGSITVTLEDGSLLMFSSPDFDTAESALAGIGDLVNAFPVADINAMLQ